MPRVNRDLQRRMAARRDRDRRRPATERRYRFGPSDANPALDSDEALVNGESATTPEQAVPSTPKRSRAIVTEVAASSTRGGARPAPRPFSAYVAEYAYVLGDLRRVGLVVGSLLVILLLLYFVLPR